MSLSALPFSACLEGMKITLHSSTQMEMLFLKEKRGSNKACVIPREEMNHGLSDYLEVSRFLPPPQLPTLSKKKVPVVLLGCLRKDKKKVCFPLYPENVSWHLFLSGIRQTSLFHHCSSSQTVSASRTQICGISHQKCDLVLEPKLQTSYLSDQGRAFLLEALDVSHCLPLQGPPGLGYR